MMSLAGLLNQLTRLHLVIDNYDNDNDDNDDNDDGDDGGDDVWS